MSEKPLTIDDLGHVDYDKLYKVFLPWRLVCMSCRRLFHPSVGLLLVNIQNMGTLEGPVLQNMTMHDAAYADVCYECSSGACYPGEFDDTMGDPFEAATTLKENA